MRNPRKPCVICGRERAVNSARSRQEDCASSRYFTKDEPVGDWSQRAACIGVDPELFWPETQAHDTTRKAQEICLSCPVADQCLTYAIDTNQTHGIWGGLTPAGRLAYRKRLEEAV